MFTHAKLEWATSSGNVIVGAEIDKAELLTLSDGAQISNVLFLVGSVPVFLYENQCCQTQFWMGRRGRNCSVILASSSS